ncbi:Acetyl esterase/lipase [Novosphingobium sp. CF614]|uniref:alpha/beta hydrolase n=1 Tax=Novosphingobium sp. CF614 TaxID=1884364 RepID=UPI0008E140C8|nr:alpha/beta hydrolase [Novosphingobium sp. CF614]SFF90243.1 Acetyl esterase/lipase [Novosphingobium sp. CF614]
MHVTLASIDRELRWPARLCWLLMRSEPWFVRMLARVSTKPPRRKRPIEGMRHEEISIPRTGGAPPIRTCVYRPLSDGERLPALLYLHPGGYALATPEGSESIIRSFIETRKCVVVAPDYRKSLAAPYPAAIDDCYDTLLWIRDNAETLGVRSDQLMVGGHSGGGGLTAAVTLRARDRGDVKIAFQMPIYPMIDDRMEGESARMNDGPLWNSKINALAWGYYLRGLKERGQPIPYDAAPARATDYSGLPPTMTYVGNLEPFRDETIAYVEHLKEAGVSVEFQLFDGCFHGFDLIAPKAAVSRRARAFTLQSFAHAVDNYFAPQTEPSPGNQ